MLARGCTTILSLSLLLFSLPSPSPLPPFSSVFCCCCDASALQSIWCLEALWIYLLSLSNWLKPLNCLPSIHLPSICHFIYLSSLFAYLSFTTSAHAVMHPSFLSRVRLTRQYGALRGPLVCGYREGHLWTECLECVCLCVFSDGL